MKDKDTVSPKPDFEKWIEKSAFKSHPLGSYNDAVSVDSADFLLERLWEESVLPLQSRIAELEKENADRNEYYEDKLERSQKAVNLYYDEWQRCESRLSAANEYLKRNGNDVEF